jgi:hypothetical protein
VRGFIAHGPRERLGRALPLAGGSLTPGGRPDEGGFIAWRTPQDARPSACGDYWD